MWPRVRPTTPPAPRGYPPRAAPAVPCRLNRVTPREACSGASGEAGLIAEENCGRTEGR